MPKALIGITGETPVARKATVVVSDVLKTAEAVRRNVTTIRAYRLSPTCGSLRAWRHASMNTKMSSAPMPSTKKTARMCICESHGTNGT